ncbi:MAG: bifunctional phosphoribosylaminoimidazolecarboxamide formyltransferase/IMP cyclohydrolase [Candidatus Zixiibacteriota bacterium]
MTQQGKIKRALISVSDKTGLVELAVELDKLDIEIISTGGTMKKLRDAGIHAVSITSFTGSPEVMDGRVKTLHPKVHGALLFRRNNPRDVEELALLESRSIDLVIVNLYPFRETAARPDAADEEVIENIDIGGPSMLRSAAKNHADVTVIVDPADYMSLLTELREHDGATTYEFRRRCAGKAFALTAEYEAAIASYFQHGRPVSEGVFPPELTLRYNHVSGLRYGENPHQQAALYVEPGFRHPTLLRAEVVSGKELSYNNYGDLDACLDMLLDFDEPFACILKHANPCGAAVGKTLAEAYKKAYESDPLSAFGSIIGVNREVDMAAAELIHETQFVECLLAPGFAPGVLDMLKKKKTRRILVLPELVGRRGDDERVYKAIRGGVLVQTADNHVLDPRDLKVVTKRSPTEAELSDLMFAWKVVKHTKSNAIVLAKDGGTVGIGMGQTSRVDSGFMAVKRAGARAAGAVMASDAFFPMPDGIEVGTNAGVTAIIQPGGSKGDEDAIAAADRAGAAMVFTGVRHFKH